VSALLGSETKAGLVFSKGIHLILNRKLTEEYQVLAFWDEEGRLFYVLPMGDRSMIGTTDTRVEKPETKTNKEDIEFVLRQINAQLELAEPIKEDQIVSDRSGVRPLVVESGESGGNQDWHALSRKHAIEANRDKRVVTILGGKLTDCLNVGEEVIDELKGFGMKLEDPGTWFGEGSQERKTEFFARVASQTKGDVDLIASGLWRRHGQRAFDVIGKEKLEDLFDGLGITAQELSYVAQHEDVVNRSDLLRRRLPVMMSRSEKELASNKKLQKLLVELGL
jgi:glycerol-3-phosphate dehydrogenase